MKQIALITDGWKRLITFAWALGVRQYLNEKNLDVAVFHYNTYGNWSSDEKNNRGEYNLFSLPDLSRYDGILFDGTNIADPAQLAHTIELLKESKVPVVSIGLHIEGFYYVGIDNRRPIDEIMEHLHTHHHCKSFLFAGSYRGNYENEHRVKAYLKALERFGLSPEENPVLYGDFDFGTGVRYVKEWIESGKPFPDAIVCSNDNIAAGVCTEAEAHGFSVPQDFRVTGFDNLDKAAFFLPQITTVNMNRETLAYHAVDLLVRLWNREEIEPHVFVPAEVIYGESCGCKNSDAVPYREYLRDQIVYGVKHGLEDEALDRLKVQVGTMTHFHDIFSATADFFDTLGVDGFYAVVDKRLAEAQAGTRFPEAGYENENLLVITAREKGKNLPIDTVAELSEHIGRTCAGNYFLFVPFHFAEQTVGYLAFKNPWFLGENPYLYDILHEISLACANLFRGRQLENTVKKLQDIYNRDQLTGIYNRIAYSELLIPTYERLRQQNVPCAVLFCDADRFKEVNDTYGHEFGDQVLKKIASALDTLCPEGGYVCRYGGDEFLAFLPHGKAQAESYRAQVIEALEKENVKVSIGIELTDPNRTEPLEYYVSRADAEMYRVKQARKDADR